MGDEQKIEHEITSMNKKHGVLPWILVAILALIWGSSFILIKNGLKVYPPMQLAAIRMFVSFLCLFPFVLTSFKKIQAKDWKWIIASGVFGNGLPAILFATAQQGVSSSVAGILNSLTPVMTLILGVSIFGMKASFGRISGVILGLSGAVILVTFSKGNQKESDFVSCMYIVIATFSYALSLNILRSKLHDVNSMLLSGFALFFVGPINGIFLFTTDFIHLTTTVERAWFSLGSILLLSIFGTAIALVLFNKLLKISGPLFASSCTYVIPIVAMGWGFMAGEAIGLQHVVGMAVIISGVYMINKGK